jgi:hypothetical protein
MFNRDSILSFLDNAFQNIEMPCFGNMNIDYVSSRLSTYRSTEKWLLLFNSIVWHPAAEGLETFVEIVGTGVVGKQGFALDRVFVPGSIEVDDDQNIVSIVVRGENIDPTSLVIQPNYDVQPEYGFWVSVALAEKYKESHQIRHFGVLWKCLIRTGHIGFQNDRSSLTSRLHADRIKLLIESSNFLAAGEAERYLASLRVICRAVLQHCRWVVEPFGVAQIFL